VIINHITHKAISKINYSTNLTEKQYEVIKDFLETKIRRRKHSLKEIINAMFYLIKTGCQWQLLLNDFPKWQSVYYYYGKWKNDSTLEEINEILRNKLRKYQGKLKSPSAGIIDSQSIKTTSA
jgi:putative transposase